MVSLSVVVSAYNEEKKLATCLSSVSWADDIIVIDNASTDNTSEVAKRFTNKIFKRPNHTMLNINKNYGFTKANGAWILNIDADEDVPSELHKEIIETINNTERSINGYYIPRKNIIFGTWIQHTGWYPDYQLRLFRRGSGTFPEKHIHEKIELSGKTAYLQNHLVHTNYETVSQFIDKLNRYTDNEAENVVGSGHRFDPVDLMRFPNGEFLRRYFAQEGYKDGLNGLTLSLLMGFYHLTVAAKVWEKNHFKESDKAFDIFEREWLRVVTDTEYWLEKTNKKHQRNMIIRLVHKIKNTLTH
ncbi:glycosyltransferase family 2 protein [Candidatus Roizmanbacteria bacterium]|nr:glycosyltransferase family 2 protein [Candidatus Roizmanbacteria bacterium]